MHISFQRLNPPVVVLPAFIAAALPFIFIWVALNFYSHTGTCLFAASSLNLRLHHLHSVRSSYCSITAAADYLPPPPPKLPPDDGSSSPSLPDAAFMAALNMALYAFHFGTFEPARGFSSAAAYCFFLG
jgi:hypothetical protein